eukprot:2864420-Pleurochrysis_carterae.AAC.1
MNAQTAIYFAVQKISTKTLPDDAERTGAAAPDKWRHTRGLHSSVGRARCPSNGLRRQQRLASGRGTWPTKC